MMVARSPSLVVAAWIVLASLQPLQAMQDEAPTLQARAAARWADGEREASVELLINALAATPADTELRRQLANQQLAIHRYTAALETATAGGDALRRETAEALFFLDRFEDALPLLDPADPTQSLARVEALEILGRADEARTALDAAAALPGADPLRIALLRGRLEAAAGEYGLAAAAYETVLAEAPYEPGALFGLGQAWVRLGRREEGLALLARHRDLVPLLDQLDHARRAVDLAPHHAPGFALIGDAERAIGRIERAHQAYAHAGQLATPAEVPPIALRLARLLEEDLGQVDAALDVLDGALANTGNGAPDVRLIVRAGDVLRRAGRPGDAAARYEQALQLRPGDAAIHKRLETARAGFAALQGEAPGEGAR